MKHLTTFPDFIEIQRESFCWFIFKGLNEIFVKYTRSYDRTTNTEYILYTEEFRLLKLKYGVVKAKKYDADYAAKLIVPIEIRDQFSNTIKYHQKFVLLNLPLMTTFATFVINGCERVVVSQIIRSAGVYFEKNKLQNSRSQFKRKLSSKVDKLKDFAPTNLPIFSESLISIKKIYRNKKDLYLFSGHIKHYSLKRLKKDYYLHNFLFLFTAYRIILQISNKIDKKSKIKVFLSWLKYEINKDIFNLKTILILPLILNFFYIIKRLFKQYLLKWNLLSEFIIKSELLNKKSNRQNQTYETWLKDLLNRSLIENADKIFLPEAENSFINLKLLRLQKLAQIKLSKQFLIVSNNREQNQLNFRFLIQKNEQILQKIHKLNSFQDFKPKFYYSSNLKEITKFKQYKNKKLLNNWLSKPYISITAYLYKQIKNILNNNSEIKRLNTELSKLAKIQLDFIKLARGKLKTFSYQTQRLKIIKHKKGKITLIKITDRKSNITSFILDLKLPKQKFSKKKYFISKTQSLNYKELNRIQDFTFKKYANKDLYTAILIPEYGPWIRFMFQKNAKLITHNFPIKPRENDIIIQLDRIKQKSAIHFLKELGVSDLEIFGNLKYSDFFYFTKPILKNSLNIENPLLRFKQRYYDKGIEDFSRIFDSNYYYIGKIGRYRLNNRLNLNFNSYGLLYDDIYAILDFLIGMSISKAMSDDIDHLKNRRVRPIGELLQNCFKSGFERLDKIFTFTPNKTGGARLHCFNVIGKAIREFFVSSQLSQYMDQTNPLSALTHRRRISGLGPGGLERGRISFSIRDIHPSHYGRICPIETPEGQNVGLIASLTTCARINKIGFLETPFWRVINGKVLKSDKPIYLTAELEDFYKIAPFDCVINDKNYLTQNLISVRYKQDFLTVSPSLVDFIAISPIQFVSMATSLIPFFEHDDANRALMGSNMQRQAVPLIFPQKPIVGTGLENQIALDSGMAMRSRTAGIVQSVTAERIIIDSVDGRRYKYIIQKYLLSNQETCINYHPIVWEGQKIQSGQMITDGPGITENELSLGQNVLVGYMPWQGYNFEDAILISEKLIYDDIFTSIHIHRYEVVLDQSEKICEQTTKNIPNLVLADIQNLNDDGIVMTGTFVKSGDILVGKILPKDEIVEIPESKLLRAIFGIKTKEVIDTSFRMPKGEGGRVIETISFNKKIRAVYLYEKIQIYIAQIRKIQVGDKMAGRHGNKGVISRILPRQDMPFLPDGTPIDIILNPLGVPSRMNVGQLYECLLGLAGDKLNRRFKILPFDEMYKPEASRILINKKLRQASLEKNEAWVFNPYAPGKIVLIDGRTGKEFDNPITVGNAYMLKLIHLVDDKMHSRAIGPYSLITQQPLRGKANSGGQRFGEMEVWALEGFGAAFTLKEILTIKSDDMKGRSKIIYSIIQGHSISTSGIPESFKVLMLELRSIGLDITTYKIQKFNSQNSHEFEVNIFEENEDSTKIFPDMLKEKEIKL